MEPSGRFFIQRKTLLWSTFKKIFLYGKKDTFDEKRCPFLCPDTVMLIREREEKIMKKDTVGKCCFYSGQRVCL